MIHAFKNPYTFEGQEYTEIDIPMESMTGRDFEAAVKAWQRSGGKAAVPALDSGFCAFAAARFCKQPVEFFEGLPINEYVTITTKIGNFLFSTD